MKSIVYKNYGGLDLLEFERNQGEPVCGNNQVLIKVRAAALNPLDISVLKGKIKAVIRQKFPATPGYDFAGVVLEVGKNVNNLKPGDEVYGMLPTEKSGTLSELLLTNPKYVSLKPEGISFEAAASAPLAALTALQSLRDLAHLKPGQTVLINGASGGVGVFATQIAKHLGATVTGICSGKNADMVGRLGAEEVWDYNQVNALDTNTRFDVVFDIIGNLPFRLSKKLIKPNGVHVTTIPNKNNFAYQLLTTFWGSKRSRVVIVRPRANDMSILTEYMGKGYVRPQIEQVFSADNYLEAFDLLASKRARGKIVITF